MSKTIATWISYDASNNEVRTGVTRISAWTFKTSAGDWSWFYCVCLDGKEPADWYRDRGLADSRGDAIRAIRTRLCDAFNEVPEGTVLVIDRSSERPFPKNPARPFAKAA